MRLNTNTAKSRLNEKHYQKELFKYKLKHWFGIHEYIEIS